MKRSPAVALLLLAALACGLVFLPSRSGAQGRKGQAAQPNAAADAAAPSAVADDSGQMSPALVRQIESLVREKESRTPAQQKLDSQLVYEMKMRRGEPITEAVARLETGVRVDARGLTLVDISGQVTKRVLAAITNEGGRVENYFKSERSIRAKLPLASVEKIAALSEIRFIRPADEYQLEKVDARGKQPAGDTVVDLSGRSVSAPAPFVNPTLLAGLRPGFAARAAVVGQRLPAAINAAAAARAARQDEETPVLDVGAATAESDTTHRTREARNYFGLNGRGLKIGIISDSFNDNGGYPADIASGDLPGPGNPFGYTTPVTVVQESNTTDEGRAMAQIIHDIVPGAQLFFATANGGQSNFANNIRRLRNDFDCDVIVDDVGYFLESPLHKSAIVSKAVDDVVADGAMYFASAGNAGNLNDGTSGVWEGDFRDAGANTGGIVTVVAGGTFHDFDPGAGVVTQNPVNRTTTDNRPANLFWSDPLGGSTNDYDLYLISGTLDTATGAGVVVASSTNLQTGTQDPAEQLTVPGSASGQPSGRRIAIFKKTTAATRFLHVTLNRSRFDPVNGAAIPAFETAGQANGHDATGNGYAVAATPADGPFPGVHSSADVVETFSSDGPRRIFYDYNNAPLSADLTASGGAVLQKPEITAADGVMTTVPGFQPFFGTSAAAPTAAAIAALLKASNPAFTADQVLPAMKNTAIDIEAAGTDRDSGVGIVNPYAALESLSAVAGATLDIGTVTATATSGCDSGFDAGESANITVALNNLGGAGATNVVATLVSQTPGVTVVQSTAAYPTINSAPSSATNLRPFTIQTAPSTNLCGAKLRFSLAVTYTGGQASPATFPITVQLGGTPAASPTNVAYAGSPVAIPDNSAPGVNIPLTVSGFTGSVADLNFRFGGSACSTADAATTNGVNHVFVGDLIFKLTSPSGTTVTIIQQAGGANNSGNHFCNTVLDDDTANGSIQAVTAAQNPYTGTFKPASPLSAFDGENPNGTWILNASDVGATDVGNVTAFSLDISQFSCPAVPTTTISGRVTDGGGSGVDAVNVALTGAEQQATTTNANGDYSFTLATCGGTYTVTPTKSGSSFTPPQATFVNSQGSLTANFTAAAVPAPSGAAGQVVISEFRARGAAGALDEFVEIANLTDAAITVGASDGTSAGWLLAALDSSGTSSTPVYTIPNGTVIPARGRYLVAGRSYTLNDYARGDAYFTADIPDNTGLALFNSGTTAGAVIDAAGFNTAAPGFADTYREGGGMQPVGTADGQYSFVRSLVTGAPRDTGVNADDFVLVAPDAGTYGGRQSRLGAPGPENTASPVNRNDRIKASLIDIAQGGGAAPNTVRDFASYTDALTPVTAGDFTAGTFSIRRRFTNQSVNSVTRLRFRIVDVTAGPAASGTADLRLLSSPDLTVTVNDANCASPPCTANLAGLTLEQPAAQPAGGGLNSTVAAGTITPGTPLAPGASISVEFRMGVRQTGGYRFFIIVEALP